MAMRDIDPYGPSHRSIRNIPVSHRRQHQDEPRPRRARRRRGHRVLWWAAGILLACIIIGVLVSSIFAGATVHVSPKTQAVTPSGTIPAQLNGQVGTLAYKIITVTQSATTTVPASGTQKVSKQASGLVTIYNAYSTASQRLISNTRLEAPDGKIYRIRDSVVVPGMKGAEPGSTSATIYADSPGDSYNRSDATTFTIPGFKGDPRYSAFSAKSQGPITGGFVGTQPAVSSSDLASAKSTLQNQLDSSVRQTLAAQVPSGYGAVPGTMDVSFGDAVQSPAGSESAAVAMSASAREAAISAADLAAAIAKQTVSGYKGEAVALDPSSQLIITASSTGIMQGTITLTLGGSATLVWQFDPSAVKQALLGKPKDQFQTVLQSFTPAIACTQESPCDASIRPFWTSSFPTDPAKITVEVRTAGN